MTHASATGFDENSNPNTFWVKTQTVGLVDQLSCGARALDLHIWDTGLNIVFHHGGISIDHSLSYFLEQAVAWSNNHPTEFVLMVVSHCFVGANASNVSCVDATSIWSEFKKHGIQALRDCPPLSSMTYDQALALASLESGGYLLALACVDSNSDPDIGWSPNATQAWSNLWAYVNDSMAPNRFEIPFATQTFWHEEATASNFWGNIVEDASAYESILATNRNTDINRKVLARIRDGWFNSVNLLEINNICDSGPEIAHALGNNVRSVDLWQCRTACEPRNVQLQVNGAADVLNATLCFLLPVISLLGCQLST